MFSLEFLGKLEEMLCMSYLVYFFISLQAGRLLCISLPSLNTEVISLLTWTLLLCIMFSFGFGKSIGSNSVSTHSTGWWCLHPLFSSPVNCKAVVKVETSPGQFLYMLKNFIVQFSWWLWRKTDADACLSWTMSMTLTMYFGSTSQWFVPNDLLTLSRHIFCVCVVVVAVFSFALYCFDNCNLNQIWKRSRIKYILILCWLCTYIKPLIPMWFVKTI